MNRLDKYDGLSNWETWEANNFIDSFEYDHIAEKIFNNLSGNKKEKCDKAINVLTKTLTNDFLERVDSVDDFFITSLATHEILERINFHQLSKIILQDKCGL